MNRLLQDVRRSHLLSSSPGCIARWKQKTKNLRVIQLLLGHKKLEAQSVIWALKSMMR
ncbi:Uncharacterised protein [Klebsiella michiganensis]|uniref:Uncharacterized protein n=1 Tax=Klebsiella michiganensis TaxID=1134687 RepID=A0A7H4N6Q5_9ENTR|nr:Uncharacterised protein [Klebsiella michiganensis]